MMSWRYSATFEAPHCLLGQVAVLRQREGVDDGLEIENEVPKVWISIAQRWKIILLHKHQM